MTNPITVRRAETVADYHAIQAAQRRAWGITEESYVVPIATMVGAQLHGGLVLGAFLPSGEAVGISFAFLGRSADRLCLYSQLTGIVPEHQGSGLGERMKREQRRYALEMGLDLIVWAFDPLQAGNAHFNLGRLGATAARYVEDMYGPRTDELNAGVPTDRLIAEWELEQPAHPPIDADEARRLPRLISATRRADGRLEVEGVEEAPAASRAVLEIPADIKTLRRADPALAERWRTAVRQAFRAAFANGYRAVGFVRDEAGDPRRCSYLLRHGEPIGEATAAVPSLF
jgi:predicted GNAT superfamily acetyltransferase